MCSLLPLLLTFSPAAFPPESEGGRKGERNLVGGGTREWRNGRGVAARRVAGCAGPSVLSVYEESVILTAESEIPLFRPALQSNAGDQTFVTSVTKIAECEKGCCGCITHKANGFSVSSGTSSICSLTGCSNDSWTSGWLFPGSSRSSCGACCSCSKNSCGCI